MDSQPDHARPATGERHTSDVLVWDVPSAIEAGERFRIKVGIKCSGECDLSNRAFEICDHEGTPTAAGTLCGERWPGTAGLYVAEVELEAPAVEGLYSWKARTAESDIDLPHAEGSVDFGVRVVRQSECLLTVAAIDTVGQTPLCGAHVVMHPYRAVTDARGVAPLRVAKGAYALFVSQTAYVTFAQRIDVTADTTVRAELQLEPVTERN
jgi:PEGA domain-containing protein